MLAPVLDPFHRTAEPHGGDAHEHVLGIELAADAEAAAHMRLVHRDARRTALEHARQQVAIAVRHLGGAMQLEHVARGVVAADGAARLQRHARVAADRQLELDHDLGVAQHAVDIAVALLEHDHFGVAAGRELGGLGGGVEQHRQLGHLDRHQIGRVLGDVRVGGKDRREPPA